MYENTSNKRQGAIVVLQYPFKAVIKRFHHLQRKHID